jgi:predicted RNase H-like nuclease (RuvC/YqgF family)
MDSFDSEPRDDLRSRGSDAVGELTNALLDNPLFKQALSSALAVGETATQAQRRAMDAIGVPSAEDLSRIERRLRSLSDRLEKLEDQLDEQSLELSGLREKVASIERAAEQEKAAEAEAADSETA